MWFGTASFPQLQEPYRTLLLLKGFRKTMKFTEDQCAAHLPDAACSRGRRGWSDLLVCLLIIFPILSLSLNAISWLRLGVDMPFWDDWSNYDFGLIGSLDLKYLFRPANDTLYPVGLALDSLAQRYLDGNSIAYQFISLTTVLGALLLLQWHLLSIALKDRLLAASAFSLTLFMLQPDSYWGAQNLAYHQAIPLVCNLAAISIIIGESWRDWKIPVLFVLGILSGMTYTSGAVSILTIGALCLISGQFIQHSERRPLTRGGLSLLVAGVLTTLPQIWVVAFFQKGPHRVDAPFAYPFSSDFWFYFMGKVARALSLPVNRPVLSLVVAVVVLVVCGAVVLRYAGRLRGRELKTLPEARTAIVTISLAGMILVYLLIVSAARANLHPPNVKKSLDIFAFAFQRFHFFWVTLLWPWIAVAGFEVARSHKQSLVTNPTRSLAIALPLLLLPLLLAAGALDHASFYRSAMKTRSEGVACIQSAMQNSKWIICPQLSGLDLTSKILFAKISGASFARHLRLAPIPVGTTVPEPLFRFSTANPRDMIFQNISAVEPSAERFKSAAGFDSQIIFSTGNPDIMKRCAILEVGARMQASQRDVAQVFFRVPGQTDFSEECSEKIFYKANRKGPAEISFQLVSPKGFDDILRFDPVDEPQGFDILEIEVRCRSFRP